MFKSIVIAVDPAHTEHARKMLKQARSALAGDGRITAVAVVETVPIYVAASLPVDLLERTKEEMEESVREALDEPSVEIRCVGGHTSTAILEEARKADADLIIVASHQPGLQDYLLGSTAARVVRHSPVSVLVMRQLEPA